MVHRLFLGMPLLDEAAALLYDWARSSLPAGVRLVPIDNLHVTLAFFGHRSEHELHELERVVQGIEWPGIQVSTGGLRLMGRGAVSVALRAPEADGTVLSQVGLALARLVGSSASSTRASCLHLTVGRSRERPNLVGVPPPPALILSLDRLCLYESTLTPTGAHYTVVASAR